MSNPVEQKQMFEPGDLFPRYNLLATSSAADLGREVAVELGLPRQGDPGEEWPYPEPVEDVLPEVAQFDLNLLPDLFRPMVEDVSERMQIPADFPAVAAVTTLAGLTNRRADIQPKANDDSWIVTPNVWGGIVAPPGTLKSPLIAAITQPARAIESELREEYAEAQRTYSAALELHDQELKAWQAMFQSAAKKDQSRPAKPQLTVDAPILRRLITSDATFESLHELLRQNPAGLFVLRDELTGWLAGLDRPGREQERAFYLECWNGDSAHTIDRVGRGTVHVPHACISLLGGIQPARLSSYLADALQDGPSNDGLIQRFQLLVWPDMPTAWQYVDRKPNKAALEAVEKVYRRIAAMSSEKPLRLRFDAKGQALFENWVTALQKHILDVETPPVLQAHLAKYRSLMPSLALLFALADGQTEYVSFADARRACDWCEYLETHAKRIYGSQPRREQRAAISLSKRLAQGWKRKEGMFTVRDVYRNQWSDLQDVDQVRRALRLLEDYGWVRPRVGEASLLGRPSEVFSINPRIGDTYAGK